MVKKNHKDRHFHLAMGQNPNRTPGITSQSDNQNRKPNMGGEFTYQPKWDPLGVSGRLSKDHAHAAGSGASRSRKATIAEVPIAAPGLGPRRGAHATRRPFPQEMPFGVRHLLEYPFWGWLKWKTKASQVPHFEASPFFAVKECPLCFLSSHFGVR